MCSHRADDWWTEVPDANALIVASPTGMLFVHKIIADLYGKRRIHSNGRRYRVISPQKLAYTHTQTQVDAHAALGWILNWMQVIHTKNERNRSLVVFFFTCAVHSSLYNRVYWPSTLKNRHIDKQSRSLLLRFVHLTASQKHCILEILFRYSSRMNGTNGWLPAQL